MTETNSREIPFKVEVEVSELNPHSAEAKAIQRIQAIEDGENVEWVTTIREGDLIDTESLDKWLKERGYSVKI